jgi:hypothetical protein
VGPPRHRRALHQRGRRRRPGQGRDRLRRAHPRRAPRHLGLLSSPDPPAGRAPAGGGCDPPRSGPSGRVAVPGSAALGLPAVLHRCLVPLHDASRDAAPGRDRHLLLGRPLPAGCRGRSHAGAACSPHRERRSVAPRPNPSPGAPRPSTDRRPPSAPCGCRRSGRAPATRR